MRFLLHLVRVDKQDASLTALQKAESFARMSDLGR